jgi:hypothetical protein
MDFTPILTEIRRQANAAERTANALETLVDLLTNGEVQAPVVAGAATPTAAGNTDGEAKPARKRRTKAEIEADRLAEEQAAAAQTAAAQAAAAQTAEQVPSGLTAEQASAALFNQAGVSYPPAAQAPAPLAPPVPVSAPPVSPAPSAPPVIATPPVAAPVVQAPVVQAPAQAGVLQGVDPSAVAGYKAMSAEGQFGSLLAVFMGASNNEHVRNALLTSLGNVGLQLPISDTLDNTQPGTAYKALTNDQRAEIYYAVVQADRAVKAASGSL